MRLHDTLRIPSLRIASPLRRALGAAAFCALLLPPGAALAQSSRSDDPVGRVVSARGAVFAQSPGEERRILECRDPIYAGDRVFTLEGSDVGIDSGSYYVRLGEESTAEMDRLPSGAPQVDVLAGHVRLMDSENGTGDSAELATPGLLLARTGRDQDALVFAEKAGTVSMVCAYGDDLDVGRRGDPATRLAAPSGSCVVGKPREPLFTAEASHPQLAVLMRDACEELAQLPVAGRFSPDSVSLGPTLLAGTGAGGGAPPPTPPPFGPGPGQACAGACPQPTGGTTPGIVGLPTQFPFGPPTLPVAPAP